MCDRIDVVMSLLQAGNEPLKVYLRELGSRLSEASTAAAFIEKYCK